MASHIHPAAPAVASVDAKSDYGSDIDHDLLAVDFTTAQDSWSDYGSELDTDGEQALSDLLAELEGASVKRLVLESIVEDDNRKNGTVHLPNHSSQEHSSRGEQAAAEREVDVGRRTAHYEVARGATSPHADRDVSLEQKQAEEADTRSPLERFRQSPKKALSVTDIVSPAWCELQYWYTLTKYGRKKATPAMKQGTKVHKVLEAQVHQVVPVDVETREDGWALRIWNIIQGLRTLRETGMTRELEVWGVIDGQVINGVIDEVSYTCPDPELEEALQKAKRTPNQKTITESFASQSVNASAWLTPPRPDRKVYLTDVKTRSVKSLPKGASLRPMQMQLMLYHRLLTELATNKVSADVVFNRYHLNTQTPLSDSFIAAIASLDDSFVQQTDRPSAAFNDNPTAISELSQHNSLTQLWSLMITEFQQTIPSADAMGLVLAAEFRSQKDGAVIGSKSFAYDDEVHRAYVADGMRWWQGERAARGVEIEEAFKCGICEFAESCEWRIRKMEEATQRFRERRDARTRGKDEVL